MAKIVRATEFAKERADSTFTFHFSLSGSAFQEFSRLLTIRVYLFHFSFQGSRRDLVQCRTTVVEGDQGSSKIIAIGEDKHSAFSRDLAASISKVSAEIDEGLSTGGYCVIDDALSLSLQNKLRDEVLMMHEMGELESSPSKLLGYNDEEFVCVKPHIYEKALVQRGKVVAKPGFLSTFSNFKNICDEAERDRILLALQQCGAICASLTKLDQVKCK